MLFDILKISFKLVKSLFNTIKKRGGNDSIDNHPIVEPMQIVYPRIKHVNFSMAFDNIQDMPESAKPVVETLAGDLLLTYVVDVGDSYLSVTQGNLNSHANNLNELRPLAEENALDAMRKIRQHKGLVNSLTTDDNLIACSILYPDLWRQIENEMGGKILVAFVHRDRIFYITQQVA